MASIKPEIEDNEMCVEGEASSGIDSMIKQECPLNLQDDLIKIEEIILQPYVDETCNWLPENSDKTEMNPCTPNSVTELHRCSICTKTIASANLLKVHVRLCKKSYKCDQPNSQSSDANSKFKWDQCEAKFSQKAQLSVHQPVQRPFRGQNFSNNEPDYSAKPCRCDQCTRNTPQNDTSVTPQPYKGKRTYECDYCDKKFRRKLRLHLHTVEHTDAFPYRCDACDDSFLYKVFLRMHRSVHAADRPFECDRCEKKFNRRAHLISHRRIHTGERPYKCDQCAMYFRRKTALVVHKQMHTGVRPYVCKQCGKAFYAKHRLTLHVRTHTGERPFGCAVCAQRFHRKDYLAAHTRTHTGERPFQCDVCEKKFSERNGLMKHMRTHTGDRPYACDKCDLKFYRKYRLTLHQRTHKGEWKHDQLIVK